MRANGMRANLLHVHPDRVWLERILQIIFTM